MDDQELLYLMICYIIRLITLYIIAQFRSVPLLHTIHISSLRIFNTTIYDTGLLYFYFGLQCNP